MLEAVTQLHKQEQCCIHTDDTIYCCFQSVATTHAWISGNFHKYKHSIWLQRSSISSRSDPLTYVYCANNSHHTCTFLFSGCLNPFPYKASFPLSIKPILGLLLLLFLLTSGSYTGFASTCIYFPILSTWPNQFSTPWPTLTSSLHPTTLYQLFPTSGHSHHIMHKH